MPKFRIEGRVYDVPTPESAYALHENWKSGGEVTGVTGESALSNTLAGIGSGMVNVGRQVGNMLGIVDDEEIAKQAEMDKALLDTTAGKVGRFGGEVAATLPLGMGAGQAARGIGVLGHHLLHGCHCQWCCFHFLFGDCCFGCHGCHGQWQQ